MKTIDYKKIAESVRQAELALAACHRYLYGDGDTPGNGPGRDSEIAGELHSADFSIRRALAELDPCKYQ